MNVQDYISSGILETYLLGLAGVEEARELDELCQKYPELKDALAEAEATLEQYARLNAIAPPAAAKEQIWSAINIESRKGKTAKLYPYLTAAAVLLLVVGVPYHYYKMSKYQEEISTLKQEKTEILVQNKNFEARIKKASEQMNMLASAGSKRIALAGVPGHHDQKATVVLSEKGDLYIDAKTLAKLPAAQNYQLWGIVKGVPVNAGLIDANSEAIFQEMIPVEHAEMYAITIEREGGSEQPTLSQMVVAGKVLQ